MTRIICDFCNNHMGNRQIMESMVKSASESGADICKFQSYKAKLLHKDYPNYAEEFAYYQKHQLSDSDHAFVRELCRHYGVGFLTTVFDRNSVKKLARLNNSIIKIASPDCNSWGLIEDCLQKFDEVIISTGMHSWPEIIDLIDFLDAQNGLEKTTIMHCINSQNAQDANLKRLSKIAECAPNFGLSDHTVGFYASAVAIARGSQYIEKHYTLHNNLPGKDQWFSMTDKDLVDLVNFRDMVDAMEGKCEYPLSINAVANRVKYIGRWGDNR